MNDRWFNFAVAITLMTIMVNGFLLVAATQPNAQNEKNPVFSDLSSTGLTYDSIRNSSQITIDRNNPSVSYNSSSNASANEGFTPALDSKGQPVGLAAWDYVQLGTIGFESIMSKLAGIFVMAAPIFYALAAVGLFCKAIVGYWLFTIVLRPIFGRVW